MQRRLRFGERTMAAPVPTPLDRFAGLINVGRELAGDREVDFGFVTLLECAVALALLTLYALIQQNENSCPWQRRMLDDGSRSIGWMDKAQCTRAGSKQSRFATINISCGYVATSNATRFEPVWSGVRQIGRGRVSVSACVLSIHHR